MISLCVYYVWPDPMNRFIDIHWKCFIIPTMQAKSFVQLGYIFIVGLLLSFHIIFALAMLLVVVAYNERSPHIISTGIIVAVAVVVFAADDAQRQVNGLCNRFAD